ncbi:MAG: hypothetical protein JNM00_15150 [Flavobacteriales bacterium]|nr:hypothetical protein [Flavobacteriales bacterium]
MAIRREMVYRHFAWLTALRFQLREPRVWESMNKPHNAEYRRRFQVEEQVTDIQSILSKYLNPEELSQVMRTKNRATQLLARQSARLKELLDLGLIEDFRHMELEEALVEFFNQQGVCERIKSFPYPRQFATVNLYFTRLFILLVPFGMLQEFNKAGANLVWLTIPFSALVCWIFTTLEKIGESTENPFEGSSNDVPISAISRNIEIDLREMLGETDLPPALTAQRNILM